MGRLASVCMASVLHTVLVLVRTCLSLLLDFETGGWPMDGYTFAYDSIAAVYKLSSARSHIAQMIVRGGYRRCPADGRMRRWHCEEPRQPGISDGGPQVRSYRSAHIVLLTYSLHSLPYLRIFGVK